MKSIVITAAIASLSFALGPQAYAASHATSPTMSSSAKSQATQPARTNVSSAQAQSSTTQRGPATTGQPNQDCESLGNQPGHSMSAPGSAFNPDGTAGTKYAGQQPQNSRNTASVSQYDVACARPGK
jgi:hypothetical protein